ncbi:hypothetical protein AAC387_Pa03g4445 [Persea americana]
MKASERLLFTRVSIYLVSEWLALVTFFTGFLSINCGIAEDLNYTDAKTKIFYTSDARFIDTGTNKQISKDYKFQTLPRQYQNVRFFPDGSRNCYTLSPVVKGSRYLVRASFVYGNYDGLNMLPQFDAYIVD